MADSKWDEFQLWKRRAQQWSRVHDLLTERLLEALRGSVERSVVERLGRRCDRAIARSTHARSRAFAALSLAEPPPLMEVRDA